MQYYYIILKSECITILGVVFIANAPLLYK